jgi:hypothetical protein
MKVNQKILAAAAVLALGSISSTAFAAPLVEESLFFSARDITNNTSITINLGMTTTQFRADPNAAFALAGNGLTGLQNWLGTADPAAIQWNVMGVSNDGSGFTPNPTPLFGGLSTATDMETIYNDWGTGTLQTMVSYQGSARGNVNPLMAVNDYAVMTGLGAYSIAAQSGPGFAGTSFLSGTAGAYSSSMGFYSFFANQDFPDFEGAHTTFAGSWTLSFNGGVAGLAYSGGGTPAVPVPAAVWLLGSGLLGLLGVGRRKKSAV